MTVDMMFERSLGDDFVKPLHCGGDLILLLEALLSLFESL